MSTYESLRAQIEAHIEAHGAEEARLRAEVDALRTRAEAAEARAAQLQDERDDAVVRADMAEGELDQLVADVRMVLGVWHDAAMAGDPERLPGLDDDEADVLAAAASGASEAKRHNVYRALRNVLGLPDPEPVDHT